MAISNSEAVRRFVEKGFTRGGSENVFAEGDTLFSYGRHFPMLVRHKDGLILNADKYSVTTSAHQSACAQYARLQLPFSALQAAGISTRDLSSMDIIDIAPERWDVLGYTRYDTDNEKTIRITVAQWNELPSMEKAIYSEYTERRPSATVIKHDNRYLLSSMDGQQYFICQLPKPATTVSEADEMLVPDAVKGKEYQRQGEWFFTKAYSFPISLTVKHGTLSPTKLFKFIKAAMQKGFILPQPHPDSNDHVATRGDMIDGTLYVTGCIRHPDHRMLKLGDDIFNAYENTALVSWSASGNVD